MPLSLKSACRGSACMLLAATQYAAAAEVTLPPISVGAGLRTSFSTTDFDASDEDISDFNIDSVRLYVNGSVMENVKFMFNTEYLQDPDGSDDLTVLDAVARFEFSDQFNIWAGRFLPPSDRANLYGPYYANHWGVFRDGVQDGYPFQTTGRDDGVAYWGQFGKVKLSTGVFDVPSTVGDSDVLWAGRVQMDFWDVEDGYYLNGTYYGEKDLLALGFAGQAAGGDTAYNVDFLLEKKLPGAGVISVESEYAKYDGLGGYQGTKSDGYYVLAGYLFPQAVGIGKFQVVGKYGEATFEGVIAGDLDQETSELNLNYIIKSFNARVSLFYIDTSFDPNVGADAKTYGIGLQVQM
jgi:Phosphate-selective porin O and P